MMMNSTQTITRKIGAHVSASGGIEKAVERAHAIGANCVQIFSGSPRVWARPDLAKIDAEKVFSEQQKYAVSPIFTHALYLVNLASENPELVRKSTEAILFDLRVDAKLRGAGVVVHLGSHQQRGWEAVRDQVAKAIATILEKAPADSHFLMENAAGQNGKIGGDFAEIRWLLDTVQSPQLGWCFDTCHGFAAGYGLGSVSSGVNGGKNALAEMEKLNLFDVLRCVHANDSRDPFDSGRDRHANIGEGLIPPADFAHFLNHAEIQEKPIILEVPGENKGGPNAENIERMRELLK